ncbi:sec-independent translocase [Actinomadura viridis]|uniref:Sec-independent protein translocase protein TatB n=1 Tax=Actinomadura viridis TaxID=58110 RepID=A0A931GLE1_9ACTN|nr:sec-independent translocase [Actinomadura viridis]MBG6087366.1 sec-independent protein translocase protein TatB [Actinomadura viridis]
MFDVGLGEMLVLVVLALVIFGDKLPQAAGQAGRALRQLRQMANSAKADLQEGLGPEFKDFDVADLNPKTFVRKHLLEDHDDDLRPGGANGSSSGANGGLFDDEPSYATAGGGLEYGERPPFDNEAT